MYIAMDAAAATELLFALMAGGEIIAGMVKTTEVHSILQPSIFKGIS